MSLSQTIKAKNSELIVEYNQLKRVIESCHMPVDGLHNKLKPLGREVKDLHQLLLSSYRSFAHMGKLMGNIITYDHKPKSFNKIVNSGYRLAFDLLNNSGIAGQISSMFSRMLFGFRSSGGNVGAGVPYLVGERGPEVFTPHSGGKITANPQVNNRAINVIMHIHSADSYSFSKNQNQIMAELSAALRRAEKNL